MDQNTIQIWGVIGTWVAGVGTLSAVIVSLWLAYHKGKQKLKDSAGVRLIVSGGFKDTPEYCSIRVVNVGDRPANVTSVCWETGFFRNKKNFVQLFGLPGFDDVPKWLNEGQEANFMLPLRSERDDLDWIIQFPKLLAGEEGNIKNIKRAKVVIWTSVGQKFKARIEKNLALKLVDSFQSNKATATR